MYEQLKAGIIYRGPSLIDGNEIVVIATLSGRNRKTGEMVQTYILRTDMKPNEASRTRADFSICGACPMAGEANPSPDAYQAEGRSCYVELWQGVRMIWVGFENGVYPMLTDPDEIAALGANRVVRVGSYGDGAAAPFDKCWQPLLRDAESWTAYSHQWGTAPVEPSVYMISCESRSQAEQHWDMGHRTFRMLRPGEELAANEIECPAPRVQCRDCKLCRGNSIAAKSIAIRAHGSRKRHFV